MEGDLSLFQTIVIAIVEGLTEFLPVSSTGHMIITQHILGVESTDFVKAFTPLFLTCNPKTLNSQIKTVLNYKLPETDLIAGLFVTFMGGSEEDLIRQIHETRKVNVNGVSLFDYAHLTQKYINALSTRVFSSNNKVDTDAAKSNTKKINWNVPIEPNFENNENSIVIKKFDPSSEITLPLKAPSPILSVSRKKY